MKGEDRKSERRHGRRTYSEVKYNEEEEYNE